MLQWRLTRGGGQARRWGRALDRPQHQAGDADGCLAPPDRAAELQLRAAGSDCRR